MSSISAIARFSPDKGSARKAIASLARSELPYLACAVLALVAIWGHRYPVGIDIAQHTNMFRISTDMTYGPVEYRGLYRFAPFTPYLLAYAVAYPFALFFGAIAATKCLLTLVALSTPLLMRRWLKTIGASGDFGLFGFLLAFGFQYHWGFISQGLAIPLAFGYLTAFERQGIRPGWRATVKTLLFSAALFFCHGITFGMCMLIVGVRLVLRRRPLVAWRAGLHALPVGLMAIYWWRLHRQQTGDKVGGGWVNTERLTCLFSGPFAAFPHRTWALVSIVGLILVLMAARPRLVLQAQRVVPLAVATVLFLALPDMLAATSIIGARFCVFIHAFAPAAVQPRTTGRLGRTWSRVVLLWVAFALVSLNVRLYAYNEEISGLHELARYMQPGFDVRTLLHATAHDSETMGPAQFGHAAAWITAEYGGILEYDSSVYYQMPIRRGNIPFPDTYRYIIAKGDVADATRKVRARSRAAHLIHEASSWLLFEDPPSGNGDYTVVRSMQIWGPLQRERGVPESPLAIAGRHFARGLATYADSFIRVRINKPGRAFAGAYGIDDYGGSGMAMFSIRDDSGRILFQSGDVRAGEPARRFSLPLENRKQLILEVRKAERVNLAHADWVDLRVTP